MAKRATNEEREMYEEFAQQCQSCWFCTTRHERQLVNELHIAHIIGGPGRSHDRRNIIRLCRDCHRAQHGERWPGSPPQLSLANMLWLKKTFDPIYYDRKYLQSRRIQRNHLPPARRP